MLRPYPRAWRSPLCWFFAPLLLSRAVQAQQAEEPPATSSSAESPGIEATKRRCAQAYEMSQRLRQDGKLKQAREQALICAQPACPAVLVGDCTRWLLELERALPSVVVEVRDAGGRVLSEVSVSVDGQPLTSSLDGRALTLDPGQRLFKITLADGRTVARTVVVAEGEPRQRIGFSLPPRPEEPLERSDFRKKDQLSPFAYAAGALGVLGVSGFAYFGLSGKGDERALEGRCAPRCTDADLDPLRQRYLAADVSLGVGIVALSLFGYLWLTSEQEPGTGLHAVVSPQGAALGLRERF